MLAHQGLNTPVDGSSLSVVDAVRSGDLPRRVRPGSGTVYDRIMMRVAVDETTGCWVFKGAGSSNGYGTIVNYVDDPGVRRRRARVVYVHRFMAEHAHGPIPYGAVVRHACDNRRCCNPAHLSYGSQSENMQDAVRRGRHQRGVDHVFARLTEDQVREIFEFVGPMRVIAQKHGITISTVSGIQNGYQWRHVTDKLIDRDRSRELSDDTIRQIFVAVGTHVEVADRFGVAVSVSTNIRNRRTFKWVTHGLSEMIGARRRRPEPTVVRQIFSDRGSVASIAARFSVPRDLVRRIKNRVAFAQWTADLQLGVVPAAGVGLDLPAGEPSHELQRQLDLFE